MVPLAYLSCVPSGLTCSCTPTKKAPVLPWKFSSAVRMVRQGVVAPLQLNEVPMMRLPRPSELSGKTCVAAGPVPTR